MTFLALVVGFAFGYWLGGSSPVRITAFVEWIKSKPWKSKPKV